MLDTDVLIIGCGISGATTALKLAQNPKPHIIVITGESDPSESNT
jgi:L-aspartate oxidase